MKDFLEPKLTVLMFNVEDIMTASSVTEEDDGVVLPSDKLN